ncbi:MAG: hypothetical protein H6671_00340 [Anaerolineaceae bacterium]|nr:hypothetical protein [Anaerolineaceae bacterium]
MTLIAPRRSSNTATRWGGYTYHTHYVQAYIEKPGRDIRAFVVGDQTICAIYRTSPTGSPTRHAAAVPTNCPVTAELDTLCQRAAAAVGGGILAIDLLETADGNLVVNEVNHTMEFRNSSAPTGVDIAAQVARYVLETAVVRV